MYRFITNVFSVEKKIGTMLKKFSFFGRIEVRITALKQFERLVSFLVDNESSIVDFEEIQIEIIVHHQWTLQTRIRQHFPPLD